MSVLVTGIAGFLGSHVADVLLADGHDVVGLDDLSSGRSANVPAGARFIDGSILDQAVLDRVFSEFEVEHIFHFAGFTAAQLSHYVRRYNYMTNVVGSANLINHAVQAEVKCFVFASSIAVYGPSPTPFVESAKPAPEDPYGVSKRAVELDLASAHRTFGLDSIVFRLHNVYGERQSLGDRYRNVVAIFMNQLMTDRPMTIFGDGLQTRNFTYVGDVAGTIARSIAIPSVYNQTFNIGSDESTTIDALTRMVAVAMGLPYRVERLPARSEARHSIADHSELERAFGAQARTSLKEGLRRMAAWAKERGPQRFSPYAILEMDKNLPPLWKP